MNFNQGEDVKKPENKNQKRSREIPGPEKLRVPGYGAPRVMSDEECARFRKQLIASGQIKENPGYDGFMTPEEIQAYKTKLIDLGILKPGAGLARLKASQERRARMRASSFRRKERYDN